ncbi:PSP1 family protein, partial [Bacillus altitudinis]|uniref:PSP1 family protein n=1 Tax=Bacillus altitudinis TaxID=293387 RepID=UPI001F277565
MVEEKKEGGMGGFERCVEKVSEEGVEMKVVDVEFRLEGKKVMLYFRGDGRVDLGEVVKDVGCIFKRRIELGEMGVREEG